VQTFGPQMRMLLAVADPGILSDVDYPADLTDAAWVEWRPPGELTDGPSGAARAASCSGRCGLIAIATMKGGGVFDP
jgi:hypothetical protein